jgi:DUF2971 family protein
MFDDSELGALPGLLEGRISPIRRNELLSLLFPVHFRIFTIVCTTLQPEGPFHPIDAAFRERGSQPLRLQESFATLNEWDTKHPDKPDIVEKFTAQSMSAIEQTTFISDYSGMSLQHGPVWRVIGLTFPDVYLRSLETLSYGDWYTACFVADPTQASMWGYYGDGHRGACLKFKTAAFPSGELGLQLNWKPASGGIAQTPEQIHKYSPHLCQLQEVRYANRYPEVDFFRSLGTLIPEQANFWFRDANGAISSTGMDLVMQTEAWRKKYWDTFRSGVTTKLTDWQHEQEYRITLQSRSVDLSIPSERTLHYRFEDLHGIIFGMNMSMGEKAAIVRIIESKCAEAGRTDFEFHQAYYSRLSGKVETSLWDLVTFRQPHQSESQ